MTENEEIFFRGCFKHKRYDSIEDFKIDIIKFLTLSSWHYKEDEAKEIVISEEKFISECFARGETVSDVGAEIGYFCG